jgi:hypothetical protein
MWLREGARLRLPVISLGLWLALTTQAASQELWRCPAPPVEPCVTHHGRLSSGNGSGRTIWLIGTTRRVKVDNGIPPLLDKYLDMASSNYSYVYGDFDICPLERDEPGHMRSVCVTDANRLVVQNLLDPRRTFKLLSTWSTDAGPQKRR